MLAECVIHASKLSWALPVTLVKKNDGSICFCMDFRITNTITQRDMHLLLNISDIFDNFGILVKIFSSFKSGYWRNPMHAEAKV